jgi:hypothetical protein
MKRPLLLRLLLAIGLGLTLAGLWQLSRDGIGFGKLLGVYNWKYLLVMGVAAASGLAYAYALRLTWTSTPAGATQRLADLRQRLSRLGRLNWLGLVLLGLGLPLVVMVWPFSEVFVSLGPRLWLLWLLALAGVALVQAAHPEMGLFQAFLVSLLGLGLVTELLTNLPALSASAFSLEWSEGSRYYNASLFSAPQVYGLRLPLPILHPTRYFLQSLAFLIPGATIAFHRAWQVFLWLACNGLATWALVRRLKPANPWVGGLAAAWVFLFFFQGPIYYHLVLCAVPVLLWFDRRRFVRSLMVVLLASLWAGLSRINWYPVPGVLAATLYLLEQPQGQRPFWRYLLAPAAWALAGTGLAFLVNQVYIAISGDPPEVFGSALSSPLLWYRLFPNGTYGPGILAASLLAFAPPLALIAYKILPGLRTWAPIRLLGLAGVLAAFFVSGVVVSVKIGGGGNLHNLDNFILFLAVIVLYGYFDRMPGDRTSEAAPRRAVAGASALLGVLVLLAAAMPLMTAADTLSPIPQPKANPARQAEVTAILQKLIDRQGGKGPVLFITERQLVTFHTLQVASFEPEYEKVFLMEMVMSGNQAYLERFHNDLAQHHFSLIVTERMNSNIQDDTHAFSEENNLYVERVEMPVHAAYQLVQQFDDMNLDVYAPK